MVWGAATSRRSGGRSAVAAMSGTAARSASTTAAWSSAAAVPLVVSTTAGAPVAMPIPRAVNAADRSSRRMWTSRLGWAARATARGVDLDPGHTTAWDTPPRTHSSTRVAAKADWASTAAAPGPGLDTLTGAHHALRSRHRSRPRSPTRCPDLSAQRDPGYRPSRGDGPRVHPDRSGVGIDGREPGAGPPDRAGGHARPRRVVRRVLHPGRRGSPAGPGRGSGHLPRLLDGRPVLSPSGPGPSGGGGRPGADLGHRWHRRPIGAPGSAASRRSHGLGAGSPRRPGRRPAGGGVPRALDERPDVRRRRTGGGRPRRAAAKHRAGAGFEPPTGRHGYAVAAVGQGGTADHAGPRRHRGTRREVHRSRPTLGRRDRCQRQHMSWFPDSGHAPHLQSPDSVAELVRRFVGSAAVARS